MKKTKNMFIISVITVFIAVASGGCRKINCVNGNHNVTTETRTVETFSGISSEGSFNVYISKDTVNEITVEAEQNLIPYISTRIDGSTLVIKTRNNRCLKEHYPINVYVRTTKLSYIDLEGSGTITCDEMEVNSLKIDLSGSGDIQADVNAKNIEARITGSGEITLSGQADETDLTIEGSGDIKAYSLTQNTCFANITGSGSIYVYVTDLLDVKISGSGTVYYKGTPVVNTNITGSGTVIHE